MLAMLRLTVRTTSRLLTTSVKSSKWAPAATSASSQVYAKLDYDQMTWEDLANLSAPVDPDLARLMHEFSQAQVSEDRIAKQERDGDADAEHETESQGENDG